ncbi:MAG: sodium:solute symporter family protein [Truepera sp.]|nr:sodium:solute symporter family protein [Truepera sp.]
MASVTVTVGIIALYLGVLALIGIWSYRKTGRDPVSYFLADRGLGGLVLTFTTLATLLSAFTFFGVPADSYRHGLGIFLGVGVTDAFIAVLFFAFGYRLWLAARKFQFVTPSEFFGHRFNSPFLALLYSLSALLFTAPYISIQIIAGGHAIAALTGGAIPYLPAAVMMAIIILGYVLFGGLRAVAWTDILQGLLMIVGMLLAFVLIAAGLSARGGAEVDLQAWLSLPGPTERWSWQALIGFKLLIFMAVPLFPQVFQRFYMAKSAQTFKTIMVVWPLLILLIFFPATLIGVWGRAVFPELAQPDQIMPLMLEAFLPGPLAVIVIVGALAALKSTADSQLLTSSSLFTRDLYVRYLNKNASPAQQGVVGRIAVVVIAVASFAIAVNPPGLIVEIGTWSFQGSAMLFPVLMAGLYWKRCTTAGAVAGGAVSVCLTIGWLAGLLPTAWTFGWLPVIPAVVAGSVVLIAVSLLTRPSEAKVKAYFQELWEPKL